MSIRIDLCRVGQKADPKVESYISQIGELSDYDEEVKEYCVERLTAEQKEIYDYISENPNAICVIQAGPGSGKTFVLKTLTYHSNKSKFSVVIFKHDLLHMFRYSGNRSTVAAYIMRMLNVNFMAFKALDSFTNSNISPVEFGIHMCKLMESSKVTVKNIVIMDEYTVISKPFLVLILIMNYHRKVGTILCGDRDQLQCIRETNMMKSNSSFDIARQMSNRTFSLTRNIRTEHDGHANFILDLGKYSSSKRLDEFAHIMLAAQFLPKLFTDAQYNSIHMAGVHRELAQTMHSFVVRDKIPVDFYQITLKNDSKEFKYPENSREYMEAVTTNPNVVAPVGKHAPYLPLNVGSRYYVLLHSEKNLGTLVKIEPDHLVMLMDCTGKTVKVFRGVNKSMSDIHIAHCNTPNMNPGVHSYQVYPYNFMTLHKSQGMTLTGNLDINFTSTNYQGMYVAISRVKRPDQIVRITVANQLDSVLTAIMNIPEMDDREDYNEYIPMAVIESRLSNYIYYKAIVQHHDLARELSKYVFASAGESRRQIRKTLEHLTSKSCLQYSHVYVRDAQERPEINEFSEPGALTYCENSAMLSHMIENRDMFLALASIDATDRIIWLHTFAVLDPSFIAMTNSWHGIRTKMECPLLLSDNTLPSEMSIKEFIELKCIEVIDPHEEALYMRNGLRYTTTPFRAKMLEFWAKRTMNIDNDGDDELTREKMLDILNELLQIKQKRRAEDARKYKELNKKRKTVNNKSGDSDDDSDEY